MAKKQLISAWVDMETYIALKSQEVNVSEMIRNALKTAVSSEIPEEQEELLNNIGEDKTLISEASKRLSINSMKLAVLRERDEKSLKDYWAEKEKAKLLNKGLRDARVMNF